MGFSSTAAAAAFLTVAVLVAASGVAEGQSECVSQLVTCYNDLNATNPSSACCDAIRTVVRTQLPCLCGLYRNQAALGGINMTQAMSLPTRCNISNDVSACDAQPDRVMPQAVQGLDKRLSQDIERSMSIGQRNAEVQIVWKAVQCGSEFQKNFRRHPAAAVKAACPIISQPIVDLAFQGN